MSIENSTKHITVDVADYGLYNSFVTAKQGDNGTRFVNVKVLNNGSPYSLSGVYPVIRGKKPNGNTIFNECSVVNDEIVVELTEQMLLNDGISTYEIGLYEEVPSIPIGDDAVVLASFPFILNVVPAAYDPAEVTSTNEFQVLDEAMRNIPMLAELDDYVSYVQQVTAQIGSHTVETDVPQGAVFTDTTYSPADGTHDGLMTAAEYTKLDGVEAGAEVNQNAFSTVSVTVESQGSSTVVLVNSNSKTGTLNLSGDNVNVIPNAATESIELQITDDNIKDALGFTPAQLDPETGKVPLSELPTIPGGSIVTPSLINGNIVIDGNEVTVYDYDADTALKSYIDEQINSAIYDALQASY